MKPWLARLHRPRWPKSFAREPAIAPDFHDPAIARCPWPHWEELGRAGPVHFLEKQKVWIVLDMEHVQAALAQPEVFSNQSYGEIDAVLLGQDPPLHAATRRQMAARFGAPTRKCAAEQAGRTLDDLLRPRLDIVRDWALPISRTAGAALLGAGHDHRAELMSLPHDLPVPDLVARLDSLAPCTSFYQQLMEEGDLSRAEAISLARLLWLASTTTTTRALTWCAVELLRAPDLQDLLRTESALMAPFVEEVLRLHPPEHMLPRLTTRAVELAGISIPAGASVLLCLGAANRDPLHFEQPHKLDLARTGARQIAFGHGIHHCIGAALARTLVLQALGHLLDNSERVECAQPLDELPMFATITALAPTSLPVIIG